ncbi:hypothetical protein [uncultured Muribaculum sp.]|uniref:hypothetical protein n=1 Tax=uncultured Muribaculum sp. TaxID=1918613 RepID=UPI00266EDE87|nr:hypothetical protein [uncultured Muribaculum sp.]
MKKLDERILSINDDLFDELYLQELENRLETDPLLPGGLIELVNADETYCPCYQGNDVNCPCHQGTKITCPCYEGLRIG